MADTPLKPMNGQRTEPTYTAMPRADVWETEHDYVLAADVPGVTANDFDIRYEKGELTLLARRSATHTGRERLLTESAATGYARTFRIGEHIAADKISAELTDGVLTLKLPKVEAVKPKRIAVTVK